MASMQVLIAHDEDPGEWGVSREEQNAMRTQTGRGVERTRVFKTKSDVLGGRSNKSVL